MPDLISRGARRPVRQLREPARPAGSDRPTLEGRRRAARVQGGVAPLPRPARVQRSAPAWIEAQSHWRPNVRRFSLQLLDELRPRPVTRDLDWGVRVPVAGYDERDDKRIYVWIDAVVGYLSASVEWAAPGDADAWRLWWQTGARHFYFMGKDNIVFHSVICRPAARLRGGRRAGRRAGPRAALRRRLERVRPWRASSSRRAGTSSSTSATSSTGTAPTALYHSRQPAPRRTTPISRGGVRAAQQRRARCHLGQPRQSVLQSAYRNFRSVPTPGR